MSPRNATASAPWNVPAPVPNETARRYRVRADIPASGLTAGDIVIALPWAERADGAITDQAVTVLWREDTAEPCDARLSWYEIQRVPGRIPVTRWNDRWVPNTLTRKPTARARRWHHR
ncbi:hypothetical protein V6N00_12445 [Tersicoccus sp. MR15.9]|uniref:hypothetical protein n=1 Tax=Tersicoccus mangrovi TaxID=3121635 RepID=UPI002FE65848